MSHPQALGQCRHWLKARGITPIAYPDTAGAAALVAELNDPKVAALAPPPARENLRPRHAGERHRRCRAQHDALRDPGARALAR